MFLDEAGLGGISRRALEASIGNGGVIGPRNVPTTSKAHGIWLLSEVQQAKADGVWPGLVVPIEYLVIAGGGAGGGSYRGGGGGAGGYRTNVVGDLSGDSSAAEAELLAEIGTVFPVVVGAGGSAVSVQNGGQGLSSIFGDIEAYGGGGGGKYGAGAPTGSLGSGGGGGDVDGSNPAGAAGTANQGGDGGGTGTAQCGGGGGAASGNGNAGGSGATDGDGANGLTSSIDGLSTPRAGGGGGGAYGSGNDTIPGEGGGGEGGNGDSPYQNGAAGTANTGGGGGGSSGTNSTGIGGNGGSGVVILRIPDNYVFSFSEGVTYSLSTSVSGYNVYTITATSTTDETATLERA